MKRLMLGLPVAALALAGAAFAAEGRWGGQDNQTITRAEAQAKAEHLFDKLDVNHDGKLDHADRVAHLNEMFDKIDTNHDGMISRDEFMAAHDHMMGGHMMSGHGMGGPGMGMPPGGQPGMAPGMGHMGGMGHMRRGGELLMAIMHMADPNHTGVITRQAFVGAALALFDKADTNHDGKLTPEERHAAQKALQEAMRAHWQAHGGMEGGMGAGSGGAMPPPGN